MISPEELGFVVHGYSGDEALVLCPYHDDHNPSARLNVKTGLFHCFVCGTGKRAKDIAREFGGHVSEITEMARRKFEEPEIDWRSRFLACPLALDNEYLKKRKVPEIAVRKLLIREYEDGIIFPLFGSTSGDVIGVQVRQYTKEPKYVFYGERPAIYPLTGYPPRGDAILVEGIFSVIRGRSAGFEVFAVMGAASVAPAMKYFFDRTKVRGVFDPDEAGYIASAKLASVGIACISTPFIADEQSTADWKMIMSDRTHFTMNAGSFVEHIASGDKRKSIAKQILKFEKENK